MSATNTPTPPALLRAVALLKRAAEHAASMGEDLDNALRALEAVRDSLPEAQQYKVAHLLIGARVRLLDASTGRDRLPVLAEEAESLCAKLPAPAAQEGGAA
jgi:hypothetical protein